MEEKNELSDIILEKNSNKSMRAKRILIIVALLIVLFLIVLVVMKVVNKPTERNNNTKLILPPNTTEKVVEYGNKDDELFKQIPITQDEDKKESFEKMVKSLKAKEMKKQEIVQPKAKKVISAQKVQKNLEKVATKKIEKAIPIKIKTTKVDGTVAIKGVYIQVGATSRLTPDKKFLAKLAAENHEYRLLPIDIKGTKVTKILIGPYKTNTEAKAKLADIKTNINKDAFIYRVK
jgi:DedD protein